MASLISTHFAHTDVQFKFNKNIPFSKDKEAYQLSVTSEKITISANNAKGIFYGLQTLFQIAEQNNIIPCLQITDYPQYAWRGFMLDMSRHFFTVEEIKQLLNVMAMYKMNIFHWHLCDDQGWRLQIKNIQNSLLLVRGAKKYPVVFSIANTTIPLPENPINTAVFIHRLKHVI